MRGCFWVHALHLEIRTTAVPVYCIEYKGVIATSGVFLELSPPNGLTVTIIVLSSSCYKNRPVTVSSFFCGGDEMRHLERFPVTLAPRVSRPVCPKQIPSQRDSKDKCFV